MNWFDIENKAWRAVREKVYYSTWQEVRIATTRHPLWGDMGSFQSDRLHGAVNQVIQSVNDQTKEDLS